MVFDILKTISFALFLFFISFSDFVFAAKCTGAEPYTPVKVTLPSTITISPEIAIGAVLGTVTSTFPTGRTTGACDITGPGGTVPVNGTGIPDGNLYPTTIPGILYRAKMTAGWSVTGIKNEYWPAVGSFTGVWTYDGGYAGGTFTIELIKSGAIAGNMTWIPGVLGTVQVISNGVTYNFIEMYSNDPIQIKPLNPACKVTKAIIPVALEPVSVSSLKTTGSTAGEQSVDIPLTCSTSANISMDFEGDFADSTNAVLKNGSSSDNKNNVGIQILNTSGNPLQTRENIGAVNGSVSYQIKARYYALTDEAPVGDVSSTIYATIVYN